METTTVSRLTLSALLLGTLNCVPTPGIVVPPTSPMETVSGQSFLSIPFVAHLEDVGPCETAPPTSRQVRAVRVSSAWQPVDAMVSPAQAEVFAAERIALPRVIDAGDHFGAVAVVHVDDTRLSVNCDGISMESGFLIIGYPIELSTLVTPAEDGFGSIADLQDFAESRWHEAGRPVQVDELFVDRLLDPAGDGECATCDR